MKVIARTTLYVASAILLTTLLVFVAIVTFPGIAGGDAAYIVTSDSMSPTIEAGDVVITRDVSSETIKTGDVVTFHDESRPESESVTHRVVEIREEDDGRYFRTKGDANEAADDGLVPAEYAQGKLHLHIPSLGYLLLFARSSVGLVVLVIAPGLVLVGSGGWQLLREFGSAPCLADVHKAIVDRGRTDDTADRSEPMEPSNESTVAEKMTGPTDCEPPLDDPNTEGDP